MPKPLDFHIVNYEDLQFKTSDDINIRGYLLKQHRAKDVPTLMYFHANAGNMVMSLWGGGGQEAIVALTHAFFHRDTGCRSRRSCTTCWAATCFCCRTEGTV